MSTPIVEPERADEIEAFTESLTPRDRWALWCQGARRILTKPLLRAIGATGKTRGVRDWHGRNVLNCPVDSRHRLSMAPAAADS